MSIRDNFDKVSRQRREIAAKRMVAYREQSKQRLMKSIETKFRTCFIGAIHSIENHLGDILKDIPDYELVWESLRQEILDKGNYQLRCARREIEEYEVEWKQKTYSVNTDQPEEKNYNV